MRLEARKYLLDVQVAADHPETDMAIAKRTKTGQLPPPAAAVPFELYSKARVREFDKVNCSSAAEDARVAKALKRRRR